MTSGYKIIDLKGKAIDTSTGTTIAGTYAQIEGAVKPILLTGLVIGTSEIKPCFVSFTLSSTDYVCRIGAGTLTVDDDDKITYTADET